MSTLRIPFPACPLCGGKARAHVGTFDCTGFHHYAPPLPKTLTWVRCSACGHVHTDGYWSAEGLHLLLAKAQESQLAGGNFDQKRALWAPVVQAVLERLPDAQDVFRGRKSWLDVGCGDGALVMTAVEFGFDALGLDSRQEAVDRLAALGYRAERRDFLQVGVSSPLDVVSLADVLEHLPYPVQALQKAHRILKPGGVLYLSCPNMDSIAWRSMDTANANPYWIEMEHCHNFTRGRMMQLLGQYGFEPVRYGVSQRYKAGMEIVGTRR